MSEKQLERCVRDQIIETYCLVPTIRLGVIGWTDAAMTFMTEDQMAEAVRLITRQLDAAKCQAPK